MKTIRGTHIVGLALAMVAIAASGAWAQGRTLTLDEALRLADEQSVDVRKARLALERAEHGIASARALFLPEVNASADYSLNLQRQVFFVAPGTPLNQTETTQAFTVGSRHSAGLALNVVQPLYDPLRRMQQMVAESGAEVSRAQLAAAQALVRMNAEKAYYRAVYARSESQARQRQIETATRNLDISLAKFRQGRALALDTITAGASVARAKAEAERARYGYLSALLTLAQILDLPDYQNLDVSGELVVPSEPGPSGGDPGLTMARPNSAQKVVAETQRAAAASSARLEAGTAYPVINAVGRWQALGQSSNTVPDDARWAMTSHVGLAAQWPISNLWRFDSREEEALLRVREAELEIERIVKNDSAHMESLVLAMRAARAQLLAEQASVTQTQRAVDITMILYKEGRATLLDVENAQSRVLDARLAEERVKLQFLDAYAEFKAIAGE